MINCIVIDDTPLAIQKLESYISQIPVLNLMHSFNNALEALSYMHTNVVNLVFLDIQMEVLNGLQFMESLQYKPKIIIVSAYSEYAVDGFNHCVTDYLLKPYSFERFLKAVDKVQSDLNYKSSKQYVFVKTEYRMERINFIDILYIEGMGAYLQIVTAASKVMTLLNFQQIEALLPTDNFIRTHKSFIVSIDKIDSIERNIIKIRDKRIPVGKNFRKDFYNRL